MKKSPTELEHLNSFQTPTNESFETANEHLKILFKPNGQ